MRNETPVARHCQNFLGKVVFSLVLLSLPASIAMAADDYVPGEVIVKMKGRPSGSKSAAFMGQVSGKLALKNTFGQLNLHHMTLKPGSDLNQVLTELRANPDVEYAEPNFLLYKADDVVGPTDNRIYSVQEASDVAAQSAGVASYNQSFADTKVTETWSQLSHASTDVIVAVVDTGVDYNHTVFNSTSAIWTNPGEIPGNGIDDDGNGYIDDVRGWNFFAGTNNPMDDDNHGTHVAGIVVGMGQDIISGGSYSASRIKIMPLKFLGANGSGSTSSAIAAIYYAVNNGAQVINNSWGGGSYSQALHDALAYAYTHNVVIVSAAGNAHSNNDSVAMYPANYPVPSAISVAATNDWDTLASFSNYGIATVHMAAPGVGIYSTVPGNSFQYMSGTSMASPFVAGLAALAILEAPNLSGYQIRNLIVNSSTPISGLVPKVISGSRASGLSTVVTAKTETTLSASQPAYVASAPAGYRAPSSATAPKVGGCGIVSTSVMAKSFGGPRDGGEGPFDSPIALAVALSLLPLVVWQVVKMRVGEGAKDQGIVARKHERFMMDSEITVRVGDRQLVAQMKTISMGGASFQADALLEKGGVVTLQISSPSGDEQLQVEGRVVWNEKNQAYGVQFQEASDTVLGRISGWTKGLAKSAG